MLRAWPAAPREHDGALTRTRGPDAPRAGPGGQVYEQVATLFRYHPDLLIEFSQFLPEAVPHQNAHMQAMGTAAAGGRAGVGGWLAATSTTLTRLRYARACWPAAAQR